ncbi:MAG: DUF2306 domain-containing protein [Bacteroidia bacterium]
MENIRLILLFLHIAGGTVSLITGFYNIINRKGSKIHRKNGFVYVLGMFLATLSGILLAFIGDNQFLFLIGVFSFYLAFSGYRILSIKDPLNAKKIDFIIAFITAFFAVYMIFSSFKISDGLLKSINPITIVFGLISLIYSVVDLFLFYGKRKAQKNHWLFNHIIRMMASYISAVTAFLVVNITMLPPLVIWLGPSVVGSVLISIFINKYKRKLKVNESV